MSVYFETFQATKPIFLAITGLVMLVLLWLVPLFGRMLQEVKYGARDTEPAWYSPGPFTKITAAAGGIL
ncbi:MAG: hypothetical protein LUQ64_04030 [Methanomicrobiales archaeon]|nr:hypothetical protein [Methanomicrobiales archaeon]